MNIVVTNAVLGNAGDAAIFEGIVESFSRALEGEDLAVTVFDSNAAETARFYPQYDVFQQLTVSPAAHRVSRVAGRAARLALMKAAVGRGTVARVARRVAPGRWRLRESLAALTAADIVVSSGGTYLVDHYRFAHRASELESIRRLGVPITLWTQSMGPFGTPEAQKSIRRISKVVDRVYFRDEKSRRAWVRAVGPVAVESVVEDVAFALGAVRSDDPPEVSSSLPRTAIFSVRSWSGLSADSWASYVDALRAAAERLIADGWTCLALSTCQGLPSYSIDDSRVALEIFENLKVDVIRDHFTPKELQEAISRADLVVSTRMHFAILSLLQQTPVIGIAYEFKTRELFNRLDLGDFVAEMTDVNAEWLLSAVSAAVEGSRIPVLSDPKLAELQSLARQPAEEVVGAFVAQG